jgi:trimethylamine:corrinoid methyltransferase-like protein
VQFILERDMGEGLWRLGQGIAVSEDTLAVDVIAQVGSGGEHSFLDSEHTLHHYRETWFPRFLYRGEYEDDDVEHHRDKAMLDAANAHYKDAISRYAPPAIDSGKLRDVLKIVERARQALLG